MKMLKSTLILLTATAFFACQKSGTSGKSCDDYWIAKKKEEWKALSSCSPEYKHYLGKGVYQGTVLYYTSVSCVACDVTPPEYGMTCKGDTIRVANWSEVTDNKILATCGDR